MLTKGEVIAIFGLANVMIGGTVLVLPLFGNATGYLLIPIITILLTILSAFSCYLMTLHLGNCPNIRISILEHFEDRHWVTVIYNVIIGISLIGVVINYFLLILIQLEGFMQVTDLTAVIVFFIMVGLTTLLRNFHLG